MNVFRIVLPGADAKRAKLEEEVVSSTHASPKVDTAANPPHVGLIFVNWNTSTLTFAPDAQKIIYSFPHNYDYPPAALMSFKFDNGSVKREGAGPFQVGALGIITVTTDNTNFYLKYISTDIGSPLTAIPAFTMQIRYYIFAERGYS